MLKSILKEKSIEVKAIGTSVAISQCQVYLIDCIFGIYEKGFLKKVGKHCSRLTTIKPPPFENGAG